MGKLIYPGLLESGKTKVTFENNDGTKKAVILFDFNKDKDEINLELLYPSADIANKDRHEIYMYQALAYMSHFVKEK